MRMLGLIPSVVFGHDMEANGVTTRMFCGASELSGGTWRGGSRGGSIKRGGSQGGGAGCCWLS